MEIIENEIQCSENKNNISLVEDSITDEISEIVIEEFNLLEIFEYDTTKKQPD